MNSARTVHEGQPLQACLQAAVFLCNVEIQEMPMTEKSKINV